MTFWTRCVYAFIGFFSSGLLCVVALGASYMFLRVPFSLYIVGSGCFMLFFTAWGFFSGESMVDQLTSMWDNYM